MLQKNYHPARIAVTWAFIRFLRAHHERWRHLRLHHGRTNKNRRYNIKPILPTQTDWHDDTKLRTLYRTLPVLTAEQIYSATKVLRIFGRTLLPINDAMAEEMPYEQLPDFVESERPINRPEIRKAMLYIEKNLSKRVSLRRISEHIHLASPTSLRFLKMIRGFQ